MTLLIFLILVIQDRLLALDLLPQFIHFFNLVAHQLLALSFDFDNDDACYDEEREAIDCIECFHLILSFILDHYFCVECDSGEDDHGQNEENQAENRMNLALPLIIYCLGVEIGLLHHLVVVGSRSISASLKAAIDF